MSFSLVSGDTNEQRISIWQMSVKADWFSNKELFEND
jgi:hypothetical protein